MNINFIKTKLTPLITVFLCYLLYQSGHFQMLIAALLIVIASAIEYRKDLFHSLGFQRKRFSTKNLLVIAPICAVILYMFNFFMLGPCIIYFTGQPIDYSMFEPLVGDLPKALGLFALSWTSAAFGEEIVFKGYLMQQFTKFFGSSRISLTINIILFGALFGLSHAYQGTTGVILTGVTAIITSVIFLLRKNDLWFNIAIHGFNNTIGITCIYFGWLF